MRYQRNALFIIGLSVSVVGILCTLQNGIVHGGLTISIWLMIFQITIGLAVISISKRVGK